MSQCWRVILAVALLVPAPTLIAAEATPQSQVPPASESGPNFSRDVIPTLTKLGCNSGGCHGSFQGRGGFRLSLWGFDPAADFRALTSEARGRRFFAAAPERSLFLLKPRMAVPHGGGKRLEAGSEAERILVDWLNHGTPGPAPSDPQITRLKVQPTELLLQPGETAQLQVHATWSDGTVSDVARWVLYETKLDEVASVTPLGLVKANGSGRSTLSLRFQGHVAAVPVSVPFANSEDQVPGSQPALTEVTPEEVNYIDQHIAADWKRLGLASAPLADDAEFLRRVSLDITGTLPTVVEVRQFLASQDPAKRQALIDSLLNRPEYVEYWSLKWSDLLRIHRRSLGEKGVASFSGWLREALRENRPMQRVVAELLTAQGNLYTSGPVAFYFVDKTPQELAETTAQIFLGVRMQCARCHHHPFEVWSQDDYYGLAAFFTRVQRKDTRDAGRFGGAQALQLVTEGTMQHPDSGQVVPPRLFGEPLLEVAPGQDLRGVLAEWLGRPENPFFARNLVNRYWGWLIGRGLVEPMDDIRATNPASNPALLEALSKDFIDHGYDAKHIIRTICLSKTYQLAAEIAPSRDIDGMFFTHRIPRRIPAEVLLDAINQAAGTVEAFDSLPAGMRAVSLPDPAVTSSFLDTFGRPARVSVCECERPSRPDLRQVLYLSNSPILHEKISAKSGRVAHLLAASNPDAELIAEFYLATLSRLPLAEEIETSQRLIAAAPSRTEGCEDLLWALLNCSEFVFNH